MTAFVALFAFAMFALLAFGLWMGINARTGPQFTLGTVLAFVGAVALLVMLLLLLALPAHARDDGRYAGSPLKPWFDSLKSGKGPCCSDADGTALSDVDWESRSGRYRVRIEGEWIDVPDDAVIKEPNRAGRTMVWPVFYRGMGAPVKVDIRCFMPGSMI